MSLVSIGLDYFETTWNFCLLEDGRVRDCQSFQNSQAALNWLFSLSSLHPDSPLGFSSRLDCAFSPLFSLLGHALLSLSSFSPSLPDSLLSLSLFPLRAYSLPSLKYLPSIPAYRLLLRPTMAPSPTLCSIATLLYHMRHNEATWTEMRFLFLEIGPWTSTITVVQDGQIVDSLLSPPLLGNADPFLQKQAFWEYLTYHLSALMALYHFEDIVISPLAHSHSASLCQDEVIQRFGDLYPFYLYPQDDPRLIGFEPAIGAALLVSGLSQSGVTSEIATHLLTRLS